MTRQDIRRRRQKAYLIGVALLASLAGSTGLWAQAGPDAFQYRILAVRNTSPGEFPEITYSVVNPQTGEAYDLATDLAWTQVANGSSRLFLQVGWDTRDFTNTDSGSNLLAGGRGAALPIPVNALEQFMRNGDGTYTVVSPLPVPTAASGTGIVAMEGHPAGPDPTTGLYTVRVPVKSVYRYFTITDEAVVPRRQVVDSRKCMVCHRSDGTGVAPRLTAHGNNRTEEPQVCVVCHNPNNTDIPFRLSTHPKPRIGSYVFPEQSIDFKTMIHGIHASAAGFRRTALVVIGRNGTIFDASTLERYPRNPRDCAACHVDDGARGTFELPLAPTVLGSTFNTRSFMPDGTVEVDTDPTNDVKVTPTAAVCSSCHDRDRAVNHMVQRGGASFSATAERGTRERCAACHGPGRDKSVRKVHR